MKLFSTESKPTGKPVGRKNKLTTKQRRQLERQEAEEAVALQCKLKQEFLDRHAARRAQEVTT